MNRSLHPRDDDNERDKPRNKRRYDGKDKRPDTPARETDRGVTRSRGKNPDEWDEDWNDEDLDDVEDLDLDDEDDDWDDTDEDDDDWGDDPGYDDDDDR